MNKMIPGVKPLNMRASPRASSKGSSSLRNIGMQISSSPPQTSLGSHPNLNMKGLKIKTTNAETTGVPLSARAHRSRSCLVVPNSRPRVRSLSRTGNKGSIPSLNRPRSLNTRKSLAQVSRADPRAAKSPPLFPNPIKRADFQNPQVGRRRNMTRNGSSASGPPARSLSSGRKSRGNSPAPCNSNSRSIGYSLARKGEQMNKGKEKIFSVAQFKYIIHQCESELRHGGDGTVTEEQLIHILMAFGMTHQRAFEEAHSYFEVSDVTNCGRVDIDEFCTEYIRKQNFRLINRIRKMFSSIDVDASNSLEKEEIVQVLMIDDEIPHSEALDQVNLVFKEVDRNSDGKLTLKELEEWYAKNALLSRKKRERAIRARRFYRVDKLKHERPQKDTKTGITAITMSTEMRIFTCSFYEVPTISFEQREKQFVLDAQCLDNVLDLADKKTEIPVIRSILDRHYPELCDVFKYYSSLNFATAVSEIGVLQMDQMKHMMTDAKLLLKTWDVEEECITMKKRKDGSHGLAGRGMVRDEFIELLIRIAHIHTRTLKAKMDLTRWLLEIIQKNLRDNALKPHWNEFQIRNRLKHESVQQVLKKHMRKLWILYNKYAMNVGADTNIVHPINTSGLYKLMKDTFPKVSFTKRDFVHWYVMSREEPTGDGGAKDRRSRAINGGDVYWNEYLEMLARMAVFNHPKSTTLIALEVLFKHWKPAARH